MKPTDKIKSEIFNLRVDVDTKKKLNELSKSNQYKNNSSAVIRDLIHLAYNRKVL